MFCFVLFCFVLFCFVLFCFVLFCFVLFCFVLFCFILFCFCFVLFCFILFYFVLFCLQGIDEKLLRWKGIETTEKLANSQNSKIIIMGGGNDGLPLVYNPADDGVNVK